MKNLITYFIKYDVAVNIIILGFIVFGYLGLKSMKSSYFPLTDSKNISISVVYPGASPQEMEEGVVLKIEDNLKGVVGVERVTSVSRENSASINIEIETGRNIDVVLSDVKNAVDRVPSFPVGMEPPIISKIETVNQTISFTVSGDNIPLNTLKQYARQIEKDLRRIEGISQIQLTGFPEEEIEIAVRENDLRAYNLTFSEVANAINQSNLLISGGTIKTEEEDFLIRARNRNYYATEIDGIIVRADASGNIIRLKDIAEVKDIWNENPDRVFFNKKMAIEISIQNTNNEDLLETAENVRNYIGQFNGRYENLQIDIANDNSVTLNQRTQLLLNNGISGFLLVVLFLALFLNIRIALWVALGIPIAFFGMFIFASMLGVTINVLSLFGMIIVVGILVDDGIVVGENIYQHYEAGKTPVRAAIDGTLQVIPSVFSSILTTVIAFATFFFLEGRMGEFFSDVGIIVILTLTVSLFEAAFILPAHLAHSRALVKKERKTTGFMGFFNMINQKAEQVLLFVRDKLYAPYLRFFIHHRFLGIAIPTAMMILAFGTISSGIVKTAFFPNIASDAVRINLAMPQGTNEKITDSVITAIENKAWLVNDEFTKRQSDGQQVIQNIIKRIGPGSSNASLTINLLPGESRDFPAQDINNAIRDAVGKVYEAESLTFGAGSNFGGSPVAVSLLGNDIGELKAAKAELKSVMESNPVLKDVVDNDPAGIKEIEIKLKDNAQILGLNLQSVMSQVRAGFFGFQSQRFQRGQDEIRVWVRYERKDRSSIKDLDDMWITTPTGAKVPFKEIATYTIERGEIAINHLDGQREIQVTADLASFNESAVEVMEDIKNNVMPEILAKYPTVSPSFEGQNREANKTQASAKSVGLVILVLIYLIIALTFRSFSQSLMLIIMIPFSLIGVVIGHYVHGFPVNILSWLGIIALIGIMVNDGLVLVDKFNSNLRDGLKFNDALFDAGKSRFRAIFLTSATTVAGMSPLLLEKSRQAQFLKPMAISISYGIIISTLLTLLMLPLLLSISNSITVRWKWLVTGKKVTKEEVTRAIREKKAEEEELIGENEKV